MGHLRCPTPPSWQILWVILAIITLYGVAHPAEPTLISIDNPATEEGFKIESSEKLIGSFTPFALVAPNSTFHINWGVADVVMYRPHVKAPKGAGISLQS